MSGYDSGSGYKSGYGSNRYGNDSTSTGYGHNPNAYRDSMRGRDFIDPGKDPHQHWKDGYMGNDEKGGISAIFMQWPIQRIEEQVQFLAASKADASETTSAILTDVAFRWLGIKNITTILISLLSLFAGIVMFIIVSLTTKSIIFSYVILLLFFSHSLFPGYIVTRMKKFIVGPGKTGKFVQIVRKSWMVFEIIYMMYIAFLSFVVFTQTQTKWIEMKSNLIVYLQGTMFKKLLTPLHSIHLELMPQILVHMLNASIIALIIYIVAIYLTNKKAIENQEKLRNELNKERMRPAEIVTKRARKEY